MKIRWEPVPDWAISLNVQGNILMANIAAHIARYDCGDH